MGICVCFISVMHIIGGNQLDPCFLVHPHQLLIDHLLLWNPVILKFQKKVPLSKNLLISEGSLFAILIHSFLKISGNLASQAGA